MQFLFSPDSKLMHVLTRFCDILLLNVLYVLTCLPVFTIGAANTALYCVVFSLDTEREGRIFPTYFRAFRENFRQSSLLWLLLALFAAATYVNMVRFSGLGGTFGYLLFLLAMLISVLLLFTASYLFPLLSRFRSSSPAALKNALLLSIAHLPRTLVIAAVNVFPWLLLIVNFYTFLRLMLVWIFLYFAAAAYFNTRLLEPVFRPLCEDPQKP